MICLDKADEGAFKHLSWNQSPGPLPAAGTTCQDLNGISNLREHVRAGQDGTGGGTLFDPAAASEAQSHDDQHRPRQGTLNMDTGRLSKGPSTRVTAAAGGEDQNRLLKVTAPNCTSQIWSWTTWLSSVAIASFFMSNVMPSFGNIFQAARPVAFTATTGNLILSPSTVPELVRLQRRASTCETGGVSKDEFNMPLHAGAVLIIWFVSTSACAFPILAHKFPGLRIPPRFFFVVRHFGTGVLIATAFVHLLPTAFTSLGDPCLGDFWTQDYPAMPGAIALAAIFFVIVIEMIFHPGRHEPDQSAVGDLCVSEDTDLEMVAAAPTTGNVPVGEVRPPFHSRTSSIGQGLARLNQDGLEQVRAMHRQAEAQDKAISTQLTSPAASQHTLSSEQKERKERLQCVLLEMGILFHSVFIGMALSVSIGNSFIILLIAIIFHQMFEGLALGARISAITWTKQTKQPWLMAIAYGLTTPIGQAIGLATHQLYSPNSEVGLIVVGVMNAISAGLLTFASLVELLSEDFLSDDSWRYLRGKRRVCACLLVFFGAFLMSLVGAWA